MPRPDRQWPKRRWIAAIALGAVLAVGAAGVYSRRDRGDGRWGDIGGIQECDVHAVEERRPQTDKLGCMAPIPGGTFLMGAQSRDESAPGYDPAAQADEGPPHPVTLPAYFIHKEEVSILQYEECVARGGCKESEVIATGGYFNYKNPQRIGHPMNGVSWQGAADYCRFIGARLPTEAEWEYAARGARALRHPWGEAPATCTLAQMNDPTVGRGCGRDATIAVSHFPSGGVVMEFGLMHMAGNVWEWVADWYAPDAYGASPSQSPVGPPSGARRVQRGGGFSDSQTDEFRGAHRASLEPDQRLEDLGFRCVASKAVRRR